MATAAVGPSSLADRYRAVRAWSERLAAPLSAEDQVVQIEWFASPTKWHLAHMTWFFETFVLVPARRGYRPLNPVYRDFWNSYYNAVGEQIPQAARGYYSRPTVAEVLAYRRHVDEAMLGYLGEIEQDPVVSLGLNHEQQHQELLLTDIKFAFAHNPLGPVYEDKPLPSSRAAAPLGWVNFEGGIEEIGFAGDAFAFDNETPRHRVLLAPFALATRPVTNAEFMAFMAAGGYERAEHWLALGWKTVQQQHWQAPLYWRRRDGRWWTYTLAGLREVNPAEPVCHVSYFEADAFARWAGARLPTEAEWEIAAATVACTGNFAESERFQPARAAGGAGERLHQLFGDVWEWTASPYTAYPGFRAGPGALGEYNGKFMCNQLVLRGGSCATPRTHIRPTYRNFFPPEMRWQFMGFRLAREVSS